MIPLRSTRPKVRHASHVADELLARAKRQARHGLDDMHLHVVATGLPPLDAIVKKWPGVSLLLGSERRAKTALASHIAFETARAGKPVLWLCAAGQQELALLMMMCRLADLEVGRVFARRDLRTVELRRLERAAASVSKLPLRLADAHGSEPADLEDAFCRSMSEARVEHQFVVIDHMDAPPKPTLPYLEQLSETVRVPFLVVLEEHVRLGRPPSVHETGLRPGSKALVLERPWRNTAVAKDVEQVEDTLLLRVQEIGSGGGWRALSLTYDATQARIGVRTGPA